MFRGAPGLVLASSIRLFYILSCIYDYFIDNPFAPDRIASNLSWKYKSAMDLQDGIYLNLCNFIEQMHIT